MPSALKNIAIIPARGGSKRIARKNIKSFHGQPLIAYSIKAALECGLFDKVIVSTDDAEIRDIAQGLGAHIPFMRSEALSNDHATTIDVMADTLMRLRASEVHYDTACCIYATAPFLRPERLIEGWHALQLPYTRYAFSATHYAFPIQRALRQIPNGVEMFDPQYRLTRSQDLEPALHDAAQFYWGRIEAFINKEAIFAAHSTPIILPRHEVVDIDTPEDWDVAERLYRALKLV